MRGPCPSCAARRKWLVQTAKKLGASAKGATAKLHVKIKPKGRSK